MRLRALRPQVVHVAQARPDVHFANREELRTEISAKFTRAARSRPTSPPPGCELHEFLTDPDELFALSLAGVRRAR